MKKYFNFMGGPPPGPPHQKMGKPKVPFCCTCPDPLLSHLKTIGVKCVGRFILTVLIKYNKNITILHNNIFIDFIYNTLSIILLVCFDSFYQTTLLRSLEEGVWGNQGSPTRIVIQTPMLKTNPYYLNL
jgi:hypothetical protein